MYCTMSMTLGLLCRGRQSMRWSDEGEGNFEIEEDDFKENQSQREDVDDVILFNDKRKQICKNITITYVI